MDTSTSGRMQTGHNRKEEGIRKGQKACEGKVVRKRLFFNSGGPWVET
jgi:hypothetical protein